MLLRRHYLDKELPALAAARTILEVPPPQQPGRAPTQLCNTFLSIHCSVFNQSKCGSQCMAALHLQVGCGAGNTVYPLLEVCGPETVIYACDFSAAAVDLVR